MAELTSANVSYRIDLDGAFARSELDGLFLAADKEHCEVGVRVSHNVPDCSSRSLVKGVAGGEATGAFQGLVYVAPGAQRTDARRLQMEGFVAAIAAHCAVEPLCEELYRRIVTKLERM